MSIISFQSAADKQKEIALKRETQESMADAMVLDASYFFRDASGRPSVLTTQGLAYYAPLFQSMGFTLSGQESFRDLQQIKSDLFEAHDDDTRMGLLKCLKRSCPSEAESKIVLAFLNEDIGRLPEPR